MLMNQRVLAVVPARGGSKGVPLKNIHPLMGKPLLEHTGELVQQSPWIDRAVVSTDHPRVAEVAAAAGLEVPFVRPESLSGDSVGDREVLEHATRETERLHGEQYDVILMLQPTSPLRTAAIVESVARRLIEGSWDAVWTVSPVPLKYHPLKQLEVDSAGCLKLFDPAGAGITARQQLGVTYYRNGVAYAFSRRCLLDQHTTLPERCCALILEGTFVSIDTLEDFAVVEAVLQEQR
jgi:CMP-N-acetylneuraminic acid synthetase